MKKILLTLAISAFIISQAQAKLIRVEAESDFSTANPPETWKVIVAEDVVTKSGQLIRAGAIFEGKITDVVSPKRLKRDASFTFLPTYFYDIHGNKYEIKYNIVAKQNFISKLKAKEVTKKGVLSAGNLVIPGFSSAVQTVEGVYKNKEGNRFKSGAVALVDSTPVSLYKEGQEIEFKKGDIFKMNFVLDDNDEE